MRDNASNRGGMGKLVFPWSWFLILTLASCAHQTTPSTVTPANPTVSLAIDAAGNLYVAGQTVTKWDAGGNVLPFLAASAAEVVVADEDYLYCAVGGQIRRLKLANGQPAAFTGPSAQIPIDSVRAFDVAGATLYVAAADKIQTFDTTTGTPTGEFTVHLPHAVAVDPLGQIWVAHDHSVIQAFRADGYSGVTYGGLGEVTSLTFGPGARLYAADAATGQVLTLDTGASPAQFVPVLNVARITAVVADNRGNLITLQEGGRIAKWSAAGKLLWERSIPSTPRRAGRNMNVSR
jgi:hypothetical protein